MSRAHRGRIANVSFSRASNEKALSQPVLTPPMRRCGGAVSIFIKHSSLDEDVRLPHELQVFLRIRVLVPILRSLRAQVLKTLTHFKGQFLSLLLGQQTYRCLARLPWFLQRTHVLLLGIKLRTDVPQTGRHATEVSPGDVGAHFGEGLPSCQYLCNVRLPGKIALRAHIAAVSPVPCLCVAGCHPGTPCVPVTNIVTHGTVDKSICGLRDDIVHSRQGVVKETLLLLIHQLLLQDNVASQANVYFRARESGGAGSRPHPASWCHEIGRAHV